MNKTYYIIETSNTCDAAGTKLRKVAYDNSGVLISRTEYIGGIQYESLQPLASPPLATDLKFMSTGEGRVVKEGSNWNYEYYHKDHLGNTRVVYGYQKQVDEYKATMETQFSTKEEGQFYNIATRRATVFNHTAASIDVTAPDRSAETNGNTSKAIGPAKMLQVSAGDRVQLEVFARYQTGTGGNNALISNLASAVTGSFLLNAGEAAHTAITNSVPTQAATISQTSSVPKSYLFYILFKSSYVYQQFGYVLVNSTAQAGHQQMYLDITVPTGGYLYTYVANESNVSAGVSVYYDDFTIVHTRSTPVLQVLQTSDYYPFGLQIAAGSYQKQTTLDNDYLYNGKELQDEHNLGWLDYGARMYMPEIGRWGVVDLLSEMAAKISPYAYGYNNPIRFTDPTGMVNEDEVDRKTYEKDGKYYVELTYGSEGSDGSNRLEGFFSGGGSCCISKDKIGWEVKLDATQSDNRSIGKAKFEQKVKEMQLNELRKKDLLRRLVNRQKVLDASEIAYKLIPTNEQTKYFALNTNVGRANTLLGVAKLVVMSEDPQISEILSELAEFGIGISRYGSGYAVLDLGWDAISILGESAQTDWARQLKGVADNDMYWASKLGRYEPRKAYLEKRAAEYENMAIDVAKKALNPKY